MKFFSTSNARVQRCLYPLFELSLPLPHPTYPTIFAEHHLFGRMYQFSGQDQKRKW